VKVSSTELPPRQVVLDIEVEQERLERAIDEAYRRLSGRVDVPGFRRGKAPRSMVERLIGRDRIVEEALDRLVPQVISEAIQQQKIEPYTRPRVESIEFEPLRLKAVVGLAPKVELGDYKGNLRVDSEQAHVSDDQIDAVIHRLRDSHAQWAPVERAVQLGDRVGLDLLATGEDPLKPLIDSKEAEYVVDPAGAQPAPGFAEQLSGLEAGEEKAFSLTLPEDYPDKNFAGKPAEFHVTLHWVKERELPAVDDEFAQQVGDYSDLAALRASIESQLRTREDERVREQLEQAAVNRLVEISSIEFPPELVERQAQHLLETLTRNVEQQGLQLAQYLRMIGKDQDTLAREIRTEAESRIRRRLALDAFANAENIGVDQHEVEHEVQRVAAGTENAAAVEQLALANPGTMQRVQEATRERKAMARLLELATADGRNSGGKPAKTNEKTADWAETSDTETQSHHAPATAAPLAKEDRGSE
jgi:trigger factor